MKLPLLKYCKFNAYITWHYKLSTISIYFVVYYTNIMNKNVTTDYKACVQSNIIKLQTLIICQ